MPRIPFVAAVSLAALSARAASVGEIAVSPEAGAPPDTELVSAHAYEWAAGARYGYPVGRHRDFAFWEVFGAWSPEGWYYDFNDTWRGRVGLTAGIGALRADDNSLAVFFHTGPAFELVHRRTGIRIAGRSEPAYMSRHALGGINLGEDFQFVSSLGVFRTPPRTHWTTGVAIQHISNAGISNINPGTEHLVFSFAYAF